jgi:hypothetical protein
MWRTYEQIAEDRLLAVAPGVVFHGVESIACFYRVVSYTFPERRTKLAAREFEKLQERLTDKF